MLNSWVRGNVATLDALLHFGIRRVVAGDGEPMQDHDRNRSVDKGGESAAYSPVSSDQAVHAAALAKTSQ